MKLNKNIIIIVSLIAIFAIHYSIVGYKTAELLKGISKGTTGVSNSSDQLTIAQENDLLKNNEDLLNADYKKFYDDLKPYGTWIKIDLSDKTGTTNVSAENNIISDALRNILGIKDAKADVNFGWNVFFVWKPDPFLTIGIAGASVPTYEPYTRGQWVYTDYGWYFRAATPQEELTHHYGRWVYADTEGWVWVPGSVWAPAWVSWEDDDDYISWTPYTPWIYNVNRYYNTQYNFEPRYVVCDRRHFLEPDVYRYTTYYRENDFENRYRERNHYTLNNNDRYILDKGPNTERLGRELGRNINPVRLNLTPDKNRVSYNKNNYNVYAPLRDRGNMFTQTHNNSGKERVDRQNEIQRNGLMHQRSDNGRKQNNVNQNNTKRYGFSDKSTKKYDNGTYDRRKNETKQKDINNNKYHTGNNNGSNYSRGNKKDNSINSRNRSKDNNGGRYMNHRNVDIKNTGKTSRDYSINRKYSDNTKMHPSRENYNRIRNSNNTKSSNNSGENVNRSRANKNGK